MAAHAYWRADAMVSPYGELGIAEFHLRSTEGGANLVPIAVAASSSYSGDYLPPKAVDNDNATFWASDTSGPFWFSFQYAAPVEVLQITLTARPTLGSQAPTSFNLQYSDDGTTWFFEAVIVFDHEFANGETQLANLPPSETPSIRAQKASVFSVAAGSNIGVFQGTVMAPINFPTDFIEAQQARIIPVVDKAIPIEAQQARVLAVCKGRVTNTALKAWSFTLDGHDFYVLKLGTNSKTLVLDLTTQQWSWWSTDESMTWQANVGMNWRSAGAIPFTYGTNVIVGDDSSGTLWCLDPEQGYDEARFEDSDPFTFPRVATGQMTTTNRNFVPVYSVNLEASLGSPGIYPNTVTLEYSDDQGNTFVTADVTQVSEEAGYNQEFTWRSLGQVKAPGRLFRITDNGAFARIGGLYVNE